MNKRANTRKIATEAPEVAKEKPTPKKRGKKADTTAEADDEEEVSPVKKARKAPAKRGGKVKKEELSEEPTVAEATEDAEE